MARKAHPELLLISAVLREKNMAALSAAGVNASWFHDYGRQWRWIERYTARYGHTPSTALFRGKWNERIIATNDLAYCIDELRHHHARQGMVEMLMEASDSLNDDDDPLKVLTKLHGTLVGLQSDVSGLGSESNIVSDWQEIFEDVVDRHERAERTGLSGIPTGFPTLDNLTGGPQPGHYWVVAARLGQGKTWTAIRMACAALYADHRVQFDALEQSRIQVAMRMHAFLSGHYGKEVFKAVDLMMGKNVNLPAYRKFLRGLDEKLSGALIINDTSRGKVNTLTIASQIERNSPSIVFIDYITLMGGSSGDTKAREQWQQVASLSAELKGLAMQYKVPIVAMAQINRMGIGNRMPGVEHLSGSDAIGHDADAVVTMRKESDHVMRLKLAKYRHGADGHEWFSEFRPNTGHYEEISRDQADDIMNDDKEAKELDDE